MGSVIEELAAICEHIRHCGVVDFTACGPLVIEAMTLLLVVINHGDIEKALEAIAKAKNGERCPYCGRANNGPQDSK